MNSRALGGVSYNDKVGQYPALSQQRSDSKFLLHYENILSNRGKNLMSTFSW